MEIKATHFGLGLSVLLASLLFFMPSTVKAERTSVEPNYKHSQPLQQEANRRYYNNRHYYRGHRGYRGYRGYGHRYRFGYGPSRVYYGSNRAYYRTYWGPRRYYRHNCYKRCKYTRSGRVIRCVRRCR